MPLDICACAVGEKTAAEWTALNFIGQYTNLTGGVWTPILTNKITSGQTYFCEPALTNGHGRYYRVVTKSQ